jgi:membrane-bound lytic murein transglycosylase
MNEKKKETAAGRRAFFKKAGAGVIGAVAVGLAAKNSTAAEPSKTASGGAGYRESAHVKKYYDLARF